MQHEQRVCEHYDYLVLGAGPAGLQLGYFLEKHGHNYQILERASDAASFFVKFPRRRGLISFNKRNSLYDDPEIKLRWDWNSLLTDDYSHLFTDYSRKLYPHADDMVAYLRDYAERHVSRITFDTEARRVSKTEDGLFRIEANGDRVFTAKALIVATGLSKPYIPDIPGIECVTEAYENVTLDPEDFEGQNVLVIGKGNSSFEIADNLLDNATIVHLASPESITMAWNSRFAGHVRADYSRILDTYQLKLLNGALDCVVEGVAREGEQFIVTVRYTHAENEVEELVYDRVIRATGFSFDASIYDASCRPELTECGKLPKSKSNWESANVDNLFFAGTLMQYRDLRKTASAFVDGFRYNVRTLYHFLGERFERQPFPYQEIEATEDDLFTYACERICRTSGLWAQFGFLADAITFDETGKACYYQELPHDYIREGRLGADYTTITFEWGPWRGDVFAIERKPKAETAYTNAFLHPILRHYVDGQLVEEHHILEDLFGMYANDRESGIIRRRGGRDMATYHREEHEKPLRAFFARLLAKVQPVVA